VSRATSTAANRDNPAETGKIDTVGSTTDTARESRRTTVGTGNRSPSRRPGTGNETGSRADRTGTRSLSRVREGDIGQPIGRETSERRTGRGQNGLTDHGCLRRGEIHSIGHSHGSSPTVAR
jgi:hypothetical protein